jgi:hypothetical protein
VLLLLLLLCCWDDCCWEVWNVGARTAGECCCCCCYSAAGMTVVGRCGMWEQGLLVSATAAADDGDLLLG